MSAENSTIESGKKPKAEQEAVIDAEKKPEEIEKEMLANCEKETANFEREKKSDLESVERKASADGLQIDVEDKEELERLNKEAEEALGKFKEEISGEQFGKGEVISQIGPKILSKPGDDVSKLENGDLNSSDEQKEVKKKTEIDESETDIKDENKLEKEIVEFALNEEEIKKIREISKLCDYLESEGRLFEKIDFCNNFIKSNLEKSGYFSALLKNSETSSFALEAMRYFLAPDRSEDCLREKDKKTQDLLSPEILSSLDSIEKQLAIIGVENNDDEKDLESKNRFKNNAFYIVSEILNGSDSSEQQEINKWLEKHFADIIDPKLSKMNSRKNADIISQFTLSNIVGYSLDKKLIDNSLENLFDKSEILNSILNKIFLDESNEGRKEIVAEFFANKLGLDKKVVNKWREAKISSGKKDENGKDIFIENYTRNILSAMVLEEMKPGSAKSLFEKFGIANFSRYDENDLIHQLEAEKQNKPYGVVVFPEADWNGAFDSFNIKKSLNKIGKELQDKGMEMRIVEVSSQFELAKRLNGFDKKYGRDGSKIGFLIIAGHGTQDSIKLGNFEVEQEPPPIKNSEMTDDDYIKSDAFKKWQISQKDSLRKSIVAKDIEEDKGRGIKRAATSWFEEEAPVIFLSCSTGKEEGIAQSITNKLGFETTGPEKDAAIESIDVSFNEQKKPIFNVKYFSGSGDVETMRYKKKEK